MCYRILFCTTKSFQRRKTETFYSFTFYFFHLSRLCFKIMGKVVALLSVRGPLDVFRAPDRREISPLVSSCAVGVMDAAPNDQLQT